MSEIYIHHTCITPHTYTPYLKLHQISHCPFPDLRPSQETLYQNYIWSWSSFSSQSNKWNIYIALGADMDTHTLSTSNFPGIIFLIVRNLHELAKGYEASSKNVKYWQWFYLYWGSTVAFWNDVLNEHASTLCSPSHINSGFSIWLSFTNGKSINMTQTEAW